MEKLELYRDGATLHILGQVDGRGTADLRDAIRTQLDLYEGDVVLDVAEVESVDLLALRTIAVASREAMLHGQRVLLRDCPPMFRRLLHLSHLRALVTYESEPSSAAV
ncbi:MAG TPA: STAS domain-containing protein [Marmoricola sp.]